MGYAVGDHVLIRSLGKGVVREVRKGGRCLVEIKGRSLLIEDTRLSPVDGRAGRAPKAAPADRAESVTPGPHVPASLDLHGMTTDEAETALVTFLNEAILAGSSEVRVIHGRSGGRLKLVVHRRLQAVSSVRGFRLDPANPGITIVTL